MTFRQTCFVLCLTALYLTCELAFNARLLDVVGGGATEDQIHSIEQFGRSLSGIALALFMLQAMLYFQNWGNKHQNEKKPLGFVLTFATVSLLSVALPFFALLTAFSPLISACASISVGFVIFLIIRKFLSGMTGFSAFMFMVGSHPSQPPFGNKNEHGLTSARVSAPARLGRALASRAIKDGWSSQAIDTHGQPLRTPLFLTAC